MVSVPVNLRFGHFVLFIGPVDQEPSEVNSGGFGRLTVRSRGLETL
jgi:hypothetical protein